MNRRWRTGAWGMLICMAWSVPSRASEPLAGLLACRDVEDAAVRLACFDREAAALGNSGTRGAATAVSRTPISTPSTSTPPDVPARAAAVPAAAVPAAAVPAHPAPVLDPQQQFGLPERKVVAKEVAAGTRAADATQIEAHLARIAASADGRMVFTLDNDQVWRQLTAEGDLLAKQGDAVTVSRGWLGSYWMQIKAGRGCKVTRVR